MTKQNYEKMHQEIFHLCEEKKIRIFPGRISCLEREEKRIFRAAKHFFVFGSDFRTLNLWLRESLDGDAYTVRVIKSQEGYRTLTVSCNDILATSYLQMMKYPKGTFHPTFVFREIKEEGTQCHVLLNKEIRTFDKVLLEETEKTAYGGGWLYYPEKTGAYYLALYGKPMESDRNVAEYQIFDEHVRLEDFVSEAEARGLLTETTKNRYETYRQWMKDEKTPAVRAYRKYEKELLETKLP